MQSRVVLQTQARRNIWGRIEDVPTIFFFEIAISNVMKVFFGKKNTLQTSDKKHCNIFVAPFFFTYNSFLVPSNFQTIPPVLDTQLSSSSKAVNTFPGSVQANQPALPLGCPSAQPFATAHLDSVVSVAAAAASGSLCLSWNPCPACWATDWDNCSTASSLWQASLALTGH